MLISVIVPTYNRPDALAKCMASLQAQTLSKVEFEILVCDDGSSPACRGALEKICADCRLIHTPNSGPAAARNQGAVQARGRYLAFLDDDCEADPEWLKELARVLREGTLFCGKTVNGYPESLPSEVGELILSVGLDTFTPGPESLYFFRTCNLAVSAREFAALGGFDIHFRTAEDREFCRRWQARGGAMAMVTAAQVTHYSYLTLTSFVRRHFAYGQGAYQFHKDRTHKVSGGWSALFYYWRVLRAILRVSPNRLYGCLLFVVWQMANLAGAIYAHLTREKNQGKS